MIAEMLTCLALNVYHESKNQSIIGQYAVAQVTLNRVKDERFPNNICDVGKQGLTYKWNPSIPIRNKCQFSWYCDGKSDVPKEKDAWDTAMMVANHVFYRKVDDLVDGATHYHAHYVQPRWAETKTSIIRIDDHIFYRCDINYD